MLADTGVVYGTFEILPYCEFDTDLLIVLLTSGDLTDKNIGQ